ncbi:unnamed protein product [Heligmosomoides polygyrus]|uniref:RNase III domain-containing protein n=1 Tax=Heligmosomoides polygyrus TaxID=6339 RepID=A0A183GD72_HELPZ|nr:unnamed protein product [Heligmosomoides polygyrus]
MELTKWAFVGDAIVRPIIFKLPRAATYTKDPVEPLPRLGQLILYFGRHVERLRGLWGAELVCMHASITIPGDSERRLAAHLYALQLAAFQGGRRARIEPAYSLMVNPVRLAGAV